MPEYSQEGRIISVQTPLGDNVLLLQRLVGIEAISRLFTFHLDLLSENPAISFNEVVGRHAAVTIRLASGNRRYINGMVNRFVQSGRDDRFTHYQAELVPWMWYLTRSANCRIFQQMTVLEIIKVIFGFIHLDFKDKTAGSYETRDYVVQYRETDFNFVSRLMEEYGIYYYFEHIRWCWRTRPAHISRARTRSGRSSTARVTFSKKSGSRRSRSGRNSRPALTRSTTIISRRRSQIST